MGDVTELVEMIGEGGVFLLLGVMESIGWKDDELEENGIELVVPLLLVVIKELDSLGD